jgi:hypothetical protein
MEVLSCLIVEVSLNSPEMVFFHCLLGGSMLTLVEEKLCFCSEFVAV